MTLERPDLPACASLHADRLLLRWRAGASVSVSWGYLSNRPWFKRFRSLIVTG